MLTTILIILLVLWLLGMVSSYTLGGFIHILLVAAVIVMMGRVPLGEYLFPLSGDVSQWILNVLNASVRRAILIGVSLGAIALSFKIIFGVERSYLGGGKE